MKVTWNSKILKNKSKDRDSNFLVMFFSSKAWRAIEKKRRDGSLKLATIRDDTWNVLNLQHITPNSKRWDYSDIPSGSHGQIQGPAHMVEGSHHPRNRPPTLGTTSVDFYHYPVTLWAYSTPQPNTEVPAPTGGGQAPGLTGTSAADGFHGSFLPTLINFNPSMDTNNHMPCKVWDEITYPLPNFKGNTAEIWEWISNFTPHCILDVITYPCWYWS